ncbi:MAG: hypothetical protein IPH72_06940 [Sandaracinaceae bacterium]|nr:hypothetical protein [Sandaracinaceae bacterium]
MTRTPAFSILLLLLAGIGCTSGPSLPSEAESREAFALRAAELSALEAAVRREIETAGLAVPADADAPADEATGLTPLTQRYRAIEAAQARLQTLLTSMHPVCAEVMVVSRATRAEELRASINTCDPGRRGDTVAPSDGVAVSGFQVGRGVYSLVGSDFHPGIAVERSFTLGDATTSMRLFFFTDGTVP